MTRGLSQLQPGIFHFSFLVFGFIVTKILEKKDLQNLLLRWASRLVLTFLDFFKKQFLHFGEMADFRNFKTQCFGICKNFSFLQVLKTVIVDNNWRLKVKLEVNPLTFATQTPFLMSMFTVQSKTLNYFWWQLLRLDRRWTWTGIFQAILIKIYF